VPGVERDERELECAELELADECPPECPPPLPRPWVSPEAQTNITAPVRTTSRARMDNLQMPIRSPANVGRILLPRLAFCNGR